MKRSFAARRGCLLLCVLAASWGLAGCHPDPAPSAAANAANPPIHAPSSPPPVIRAGPITRWDEGLPLGNGLLGALVWGEKNVVRISLDRGDLWDCRVPQTLTRPDWTYAEMIRLQRAGASAPGGKGGTFHARHRELFDVPYDTIPYPTKLPGGRIELTFPDDVRIEAFEHHPADGLAVVRHSHGSVAVLITPPPQNLGLALVQGPVPHVEIVRPKGLDALGYAPAKLERTERAVMMTQHAANGLVYCVAAESSPMEGGVALRFTIEARNDGTDPAAHASHVIDAPRDLAGTPTHAQPVDPATHDVATLVATPMHTAHWDAYWASSGVTIPDPRHQRHYDLCRFLYAAGSRPGSPPIPLQGLWTADEGGLPPWKGDYHHDLNTQMTYLAYHDAGLREQGLSFIDHLASLQPRFERFAREFYGLHATPGRFPPLVVPGVMGLDGAPLGGWGQYSLSPTHTAWLAQTFDLHWRYTGSKEFLAGRAYPWCAGAGEALAALLEESPPDATGTRWLRLPLSSSPEVHDNSFAAWMPPNSTYDASLLRYLFATLAEMADTLDRPADASRWRALLARLEPLQTDPRSGALMLARDTPFDASHRHFSHAMAIYPLGTLTIEGSDADRRTIAATIDDLHRLGTKAWCGYSFAWMSALCARAGQPERALDYLNTYLAFTGPNGFHLNGDQTKSGLSDFTYRPFTLEGNFLAMQAVHEMLIQSWPAPGRGPIVRIFPAVSTRWPDASFHNLCAQGGLRVSATRRGGATEHVLLLAERAGDFWLRDPFDGAPAEWTGTARPPRREGSLWRFTLSRGQSIEGRSSPASPRQAAP